MTPIPPIPEDLRTRYKLAKDQLALLPPVEEDDAEEWLGLRQWCEEVIEFIERIAKLTAEVAVTQRRSGEHRREA